MTTVRPPAKRGHWIFSVNPHHYHWDTLFVKGKEMWRGAGARPDAIRAFALDQEAVAPENVARRQEIAFADVERANPAEIGDLGSADEPHAASLLVETERIRRLEEQRRVLPPWPSRRGLRGPQRR